MKKLILLLALLPTLAFGQSTYIVNGKVASAGQPGPVNVILRDTSGNYVADASDLVDTKKGLQASFRARSRYDLDELMQVANGGTYILNAKVASAGRPGPVNVILRDLSGNYVDASAGGGGGGGDLLAANNLSDVADAAIALDNLGGLTSTDIGDVGFLDLVTFAYLDRTTTVVAQAATITLAPNDNKKTSATGTLTTIAFSGGDSVAQARKLDIDVSGGPYTITVPACRRLGVTGSVTSISLTDGYHELNWHYIGTEYVLSDSLVTADVSNTAYDATSWNGVTDIAGSKDSVRDKIETLVTLNGAGGTPSAITLTNGTALPVAGITSSTATGLGLGSVELGHATDTTIARSAAGAITVEGTQVLLSGAAAAGYLIQGGHTVAALAPADSTTYFFGDGQAITITQHTTIANCQMIVPRAGTITRVEWHTLVATNGSGESVTHSLRLNNTTDTVLSAAETYNPGANTTKSFSYTGLSIAVAAGDTIAFKMVTPAWVTNPTMNGAELKVFIQ